ncbi:HD domain-containing phosphohydrolase [Pseudodesulfovibrio sp.]|uniref:HD domain-containing phosphohydrolase n=1 Tax=unclassified Pseudodesulfovibrio TaxID=2661612 RepID=UPI003B00A913
MNKAAKILIVDDEPHNLLLLKRHLTLMGYEVVSAENAITAMEMLDRSLDLILSDVMMPEMNGFEFVRAIRENTEVQNIPVIMVTTLSEKNDRLQAVEAGANDFITKPVDAVELRVRVRSMLRLKEQQDDLLRFEGELNQMVEERTMELHQALKRMKKSHQDTIVYLAAAAEYKDEETGAHIQRMSNYCAIIAKGLGLDDEDVELILRSSPMHDLGKIGIPDHILLKPGKLDPDEWEIMKTHTEIGAEILGAGDSDYVNMGAIIALSHHEKWDGSGYPSGLSGEDIPIAGRICTVADVFDALLSKRPYKKAFSLEKALEIMAEGRGTHFDPQVYDVFLKSLDEILEIRDHYTD